MNIKRVGINFSNATTPQIPANKTFTDYRPRQANFLKYYTNTQKNPEKIEQNISILENQVPQAAQGTLNKIMSFYMPNVQHTKQTKTKQTLDSIWHGPSSMSLSQTGHLFNLQLQNNNNIVKQVVKEDQLKLFLKPDGQFIKMENKIFNQIVMKCEFSNNFRALVTQNGGLLIQDCVDENNIINVLAFQTSKQIAQFVLQTIQSDNYYLNTLARQISTSLSRLPYVFIYLNRVTIVYPTGLLLFSQNSLIEASVMNPHEFNSQTQKYKELRSSKIQLAVQCFDLYLVIFFQNQIIESHLLGDRTKPRVPLAATRTGYQVIGMDFALFNKEIVCLCVSKSNLQIRQMPKLELLLEMELKTGNQVITNIFVPFTEPNRLIIVQCGQQYSQVLLPEHIQLGAMQERPVIQSNLEIDRAILLSNNKFHTDKRHLINKISEQLKFIKQLPVKHYNEIINGFKFNQIINDTESITIEQLKAIVQTVTQEQEILDQIDIFEFDLECDDTEQLNVVNQQKYQQRKIQLDQKKLKTNNTLQKIMLNNESLLSPRSNSMSPTHNQNNSYHSLKQNNSKYGSKLIINVANNNSNNSQTKSTTLKTDLSQNIQQPQDQQQLVRNAEFPQLNITQLQISETEIYAQKTGRNKEDVHVQQNEIIKDGTDVDIESQEKARIVAEQSLQQQNITKDDQDITQLEPQIEIKVKPIKQTNNRSAYFEGSIVQHFDETEILQQKSQTQVKYEPQVIIKAEESWSAVSVMSNQVNDIIHDQSYIVDQENEIHQDILVDKEVSDISQESENQTSKISLIDESLESENIQDNQENNYIQINEQNTNQQINAETIQEQNDILIDKLEDIKSIQEETHSERVSNERVSNTSSHNSMTQEEAKNEKNKPKIKHYNSKQYEQLYGQNKIKQDSQSNITENLPEQQEHTELPEEQNETVKTELVKVETQEEKPETIVAKIEIVQKPIEIKPPRPPKPVQMINEVKTEIHVLKLATKQSISAEINQYINTNITETICHKQRAQSCGSIHKVEFKKRIMNVSKYTKGFRFGVDSKDDKTSKAYQTDEKITYNKLSHSHSKRYNQINQPIEKQIQQSFLQQSLSKIIEQNITQIDLKMPYDAQFSQLDVKPGSLMSGKFVLSVGNSDKAEDYQEKFVQIMYPAMQGALTDNFGIIFDQQTYPDKEKIQYLWSDIVNKNYISPLHAKYFKRIFYNLYTQMIPDHFEQLLLQIQSNQPDFTRYDFHIYPIGLLWAQLLYQNSKSVYQFFNTNQNHFENQYKIKYPMDSILKRRQDKNQYLEFDPNQQLFNLSSYLLVFFCGLQSKMAEHINTIPDLIKNFIISEQATIQEDPQQKYIKQISLKYATNLQEHLILSTQNEVETNEATLYPYVNYKQSMLYQTQTKLVVVFIDSQLSKSQIVKLQEQEKVNSLNLNAKIHNLLIAKSFGYEILDRNEIPLSSNNANQMYQQQVVVPYYLLASFIMKMNKQMSIHELYYQYCHAKFYNPIDYSILSQLLITIFNVTIEEIQAVFQQLMIYELKLLLNDKFIETLAISQKYLQLGQLQFMQQYLFKSSNVLYDREFKPASQQKQFQESQVLPQQSEVNFYDKLQLPAHVQTFTSSVLPIQPIRLRKPSIDASVDDEDTDNTIQIKRLTKLGEKIIQLEKSGPVFKSHSTCAQLKQFDPDQMQFQKTIQKIQGGFEIVDWYKAAQKQLQDSKRRKNERPEQQRSRIVQQVELRPVSRVKFGDVPINLNGKEFLKAQRMLKKGSKQ
ncbi:Conserved_hypothetical protein [Hexamita inflata]|uniref:Uncharacterized protein n=1 Tax=Hexamita inflata TaxID=28002 RepID=A0AA86UBT4_9EUKA|nr:Conserved hypothetical protein [Hexamita inflata]CAI9947330.1 Conserved hypothetical protein [Hexamita inflata]